MYVQDRNAIRIDFSRWVSLHSLGADLAENTVSNSSSVVGSAFGAAEISCHVLFTGRYHATDEFSC
jgi:hypothetical protein